MVDSHAPLLATAGESVAPDRAAQHLADEMVRDYATMQEVLRETVTSAQRGELAESGRTYCPSTADWVRGPTGRFARAVELPACQAGATGLMHTHVTPDELAEPTHSLPDIANVALAGVDASVIVGTESADVLVAAADPAVMRRALEAELGTAVTTTTDVVAAMSDQPVGEVIETRRRVRNRLAPLFETVTTSFPQITAQVNRLQRGGEDAAAMPPEVTQQAVRAAQSGVDTTAAVSDPQPRVADGALSIRTSAQMTDLAQSVSDAFPTGRILDVALGTVVGQVVANLTDRLIFGR